MTNLTKEEFQDLLKAFQTELMGPALQVLNDKNMENTKQLIESMKSRGCDDHDRDHGLRHLKLIDSTEKFSGVSSEFFDWARKARNYIGNKSPKTKLPPASAPEGVLPHQY